MKCPDFETLSADVDGAAPETARPEIKSHIAECKRCQQVRAQLLVLKAAVRASVPDPQPSARLRERIEALVPATPPRPRRWTKWPLAAAILVALGLGAFLWRSRSGESRLVEQLVGDHILNALGHEKPIEVTSADPKVVEQWIAGKVDFAVDLPKLPGAQLAGGRLCSVAGRRALLAFYDMGPHRMSLFAMATEPHPGPRCREGVQGFTVCRRSARGVDYTIVSDLPASQVSPLLDSGW
jgi:anti-sigma factor RsiW